MELFLFLIVNAYAAQPVLDLKVTSPQFNYSVSVGDKSFAFESSTKRLQRKIPPCASRSYELFAQKIRRQILNDHSKAKVKTPNSIEVKLNREKFFLPPLSTSGVFISKMETDVDYLIGEAIYRCSKK